MTRRTYDDRKFKRPAPELTEQDKRDRAVLSVMKDYPLQPGQMLLLGPKSVAMLSGQAEFNGSLPDKLILERADWSTT